MHAWALFTPNRPNSNADTKLWDNSYSTLVFKLLKVTATGYQGIENPLPDLNSKPAKYTYCLLVVKNHW